jgi:hypothetical protein
MKCNVECVNYLFKLNLSINDEVVNVRKAVNVFSCTVFLLNIFLLNNKNTIGFTILFNGANTNNIWYVVVPGWIIFQMPNVTAIMTGVQQTI